MRNVTVGRSAFKSFAGLLLCKPPFTGVLKDLKKKRQKAVLFGLIQFRDTSKGTNKSVKSLHSVSQRRKQEPRYAPQGRAMILDTTPRDQVQNTTVTSGLRFVIIRQTASFRRRDASHREKAPNIHLIRCSRCIHCISDQVMSDRKNDE